MHRHRELHRLAPEGEREALPLGLAAKGRECDRARQCGGAGAARSLLQGVPVDGRGVEGLQVHLVLDHEADSGEASITLHRLPSPPITLYRLPSPSVTLPLPRSPSGQVRRRLAQPDPAVGDHLGRRAADAHLRGATAASRLLLASYHPTSSFPTSYASSPFPTLHTLLPTGRRPEGDVAQVGRRAQREDWNVALAGPRVQVRDRRLQGLPRARVQRRLSRGHQVLDQLRGLHRAHRTCPRDSNPRAVAARR